MSLKEAVRALGSLQVTRQLLDLDDLWTSAVESHLPGDDREAAIAIGTEMQTLLGRLRDELPTVGDRILTDSAGFEKASDEALQASPLPPDLKQAIRDTYPEFGWAAEFDIALRAIVEYAPAQADDIAEKVDRLRHGSTDEAGDVWPWYKCCLRVGVFGLSVGVAVLSGGTLIVVAGGVAAAALGLGDGLPGCKGDSRRPPAIANEIAKLAALRDSGHLEDWEFNLAKQKALGLISDKDIAAYKARPDFHRGLDRPIPAPRPWVFPKPKPKAPDDD
jgi:hypothetical protein